MKAVPRTPAMMEALFQQYCVAVRNPNMGASVEFLRSQTGRDYWPKLSQLCVKELEKHPMTNVGCTSFSEASA